MTATGPKAATYLVAPHEAANDPLRTLTVKDWLAVLLIPPRVERLKGNVLIM